MEFNRFGKKNEVRKKLIDNEDGVQQITDFIKVTDGTHTYIAPRNYAYTRLPNTDFGVALVTPIEPTAFYNIKQSEQIDVAPTVGGGFAINKIPLREVLRSCRAIVPDYVLDGLRLPTLDEPSRRPVQSKQFRSAVRKITTSSTTTTTTTATTTTTTETEPTTTTEEELLPEMEETTESSGFDLFNLFQGFAGRNLRKPRSVPANPTELSADTGLDYCQSLDRPLPEECTTGIPLTATFEQSSSDTWTTFRPTSSIVSELVAAPSTPLTADVVSTDTKLTTTNPEPVQPDSISVDTATTTTTTTSTAAAATTTTTETIPVTENIDKVKEKDYLGATQVQTTDDTEAPATTKAATLAGVLLTTKKTTITTEKPSKPLDKIITTSITTTEMSDSATPPPLTENEVKRTVDEDTVESTPNTENSTGQISPIAQETANFTVASDSPDHFVSEAPALTIPISTTTHSKQQQQGQSVQSTTSPSLPETEDTAAPEKSHISLAAAKLRQRYTQGSYKPFTVKAPVHMHTPTVVTLMEFLRTARQYEKSKNHYCLVLISLSRG
ncbi:unnamed protein product [Echinostoma caproni]|uniref:Uncharacterized protein n=1 Tax=Echinostoma caproni TaxID=27848 RepID=A0A3P8H951_9TREM|nr:unnamed protein product [Echinostoma caproni]